MQGEQAESSVIDALERIFIHADLFDVVVIIRGGGATADLSCFDSYELAFNCAQFPLPVITGIGHQRDFTVLDMVAYKSVKTPTAAAEFLIDCFAESYNRLYNAYQGIYDHLKEIQNTGNSFIESLHWKIRHNLTQKTVVKEKQLERIASGIRNSLKMNFLYQQNKLSLLEKSIEQHAPSFLLKYGYSITTHHGKRISSANQVKPGDTIVTYLSEGRIDSIVDSAKKP
jgi:exodeoxyribonuclease VII large subunit